MTRVTFNPDLTTASADLHMSTATADPGVTPQTHAASHHGIASALQLLREHWPEYAIEGWALGTFMVSAAVFSTLFDYPGSPVHHAVADPDLRRMLAGIAMLVLPGQGLLTLLVGFLLIDFPGKYRFEKWLVARRWVLQPINWLRLRRHQMPLRVAA